MKIMDFLLIIFILIFVSGCNDSNVKTSVKKILVHKDNVVTELNKNENLKECFNNIEEHYSLIVLNKDLNKIRKKNSLEIIMKKNITYTFKPINKQKVFSKVFIPLEGKYKNIMFLGNGRGYGIYTPYGEFNCNLIRKLQN